MGSGEITESMSKVHRWVISNIEGPVSAVFLDTPAGFELNVDEISSKACAYVTRHVGVPCSVVSLKSAERVTARETKDALRRLERANYIFAGPGSPTYAVRNWRDTPLFDAVARRVAEGAHLVLASAAAIAIGRFTLPVYEIYKVGEEPHWAEGLDLLAPYGLNLAIVSHWNNAEGGTHDTRFCFMGGPRFAVLERLLPESTLVLGIDEYTACIIDLGQNECRVMGAGQVTIRRRGDEVTFPAGASFSLDQLRDKTVAPRGKPPRSPEPRSAKEAAAQASESLMHQVAKVEEAVAGGDHSALADVASHIYDLAQAVDESREVGVGEELITEARARLRQLLVDWSRQLAPSSADTLGSIAPFVELLIELRSRLRAAGEWALADQIRDGLAALGVVIEDGPERTIWRAR